MIAVAWSVAGFCATRSARAGEDPKTQSVGQVSDWAPFLADLQGSDKAKQEAAGKAFFDAGQLGYNVLGTLLKSTDAELVKRIKELRAKIDERSYALYRDAEQLRERVFSKPLDADALDQLKSKWTEVATYSSVMQVKQQAFQVVSDIKRALGNVDAANRKLKDLDADLKAIPPPQGLYLASLMISRAEALKMLLRDKESLGAAQEAEQASGKTGRLTPTALRFQIDAFQRLADFENARTTCRKLLSAFPKALETRYARQAIIDSLVREKRFDDAIRELKEAFNAFPVDEELQQALTSLLSELMDQEHDYKRVSDLAEWALSTLPTERIDVDIAKCYGGCNEYVTKDYAKAERGYSMLHDTFPDMIDPKDVDKVLERLKLKAAGKFPKEPTEKDEGPSAALAGFLRAVRTRDAKAILDFVPEDEGEAFKQELDDPGDSIVPLLTFSDVIVRNVEFSPKKESATMFIDIYPSAGLVAKSAIQFAFHEGDKWKIRWRSIPDAGVENPAPPAPPAPDAPAPAPNAPPKVEGPAKPPEK